MRNSRNRVTAVVAAGVSSFALLGTVAGTTAAAAPAEQASAITTYSTSVISTSYGVNLGERIGSCTATSSGSTCSVTSGESATRSIQLGVGISRGLLSADLGISSSSSVSTTVGCTSPPLSAGESYTAYSGGDRYSYRVTRVDRNKDGIELRRETSGVLYAEDPDPTKIFCG